MNYKKNKVLMAVMVNDMDGLREAIKNKKDVNMKGHRNVTALHMAAILCNEEAAKLLIEAGAKIEAKDGNGMTPLAYAVLPAEEIPAMQLKQALKTEQGIADLNNARRKVREVLVEAGADWQAQGSQMTPFERLEIFWPEQAAEMVPKVGPVQL